MWSFCRSAWRAGLRSRSIQAVLVIGLLMVGVAFLAGSFSPRQPQTVALDVGISGLRFTLILFGLFWVQELVGREIERKAVIFSLSYPVPRSAYILGRFFGIALLLALASSVLAILLWVAVKFAGGAYVQNFKVELGLPYILTIIGVWADAIVVAAFAMYIATISTVNALPLALGVIFAITGKALGAVSQYLSAGAEGDADLVKSYQPLIKVVEAVLPDLSRLDFRTWPMYGSAISNESIAWSFLMASSYVALLLFLAIWSFNRRDFS